MEATAHESGAPREIGLREMAKKIGVSDLSEIIRERPRELAARLRTTKGLTADDVACLAREAQKSKDK